MRCTSCSDGRYPVYRCLPRHSTHHVYVLVESSTIQFAGARLIFHRKVYRHLPRHPPHSLCTLA